MTREPQHPAPGGDGPAPDPVRAELARLAPGVAVPDLPPGRHLLLKEHVMAEIRKDLAQDPQPVRRDPRRWKLVAMPLVAAAAAAAIVAGVVVVNDGGSGRPAVSAADHDAATGLLIQAAAAAEKTPAPPVRNDQFTYVEAIEEQGILTGADTKEFPLSFRLSPPRTFESWRPVTGTGPTLNRVEQGSDWPGQVTAGADDLRQPGYRAFEKLPTDPGALLAYLRKEAPKHGDNPRDQQVFTMIGDMLRDVVAPPAATAALFRAAAKMPGTTVVRGVTDALGRPGIAIAMTAVQGDNTQLIFDERTSEFIGVRAVTAEASNIGPKGMVMGTLTIVRHGFADRIGEKPVTVVGPKAAVASGA